MFQFGKYNLDIIEMLSGHQAHQFKGLGLDRQLQHPQQVQLHQHQLQQQQQQQAESSGALLSGLGLGPLQGSRGNAFSDSASSIFAKMSAPPPPPLQQQPSSSQSSRSKPSKMSSSSSSHSSGYPQFLRSFHSSEAALAQEQLHPSVGRFEHFTGGSGSSGSAGGLGGLVSSAPQPPPLHSSLSVPQASPGPPSSSPAPSTSVSTSNNPSGSSAVSSLGHQLVGAQSDARSLHQQFSCMLAANQYFLSGVPANASLEQFLGTHNHLGIGLSQTGGENSSGLAPLPALHNSHAHVHPTPQTQQTIPQAPQQQQLPPHTLSHTHVHSHPHHSLHPGSQPSSLSGFDFQGIPVLSSNQIASLMQQESGLPLPLPLHLSLSKDDGKGESNSVGSSSSSSSRRKKAMAGYLPQRKADSTSNGSNHGHNSHSNNLSNGGGLSHGQPPALIGNGVGLSNIGGDPSSLLASSSSSSSVVSSSSSAPSSAAASALVSDSHISKCDNPSSMQSNPSNSDTEPMYSCAECGKSFPHLSSLRRHLRMHEPTTAGTSDTASVRPNPIHIKTEPDPNLPHSTQEAPQPSSHSCPSPDKVFHCPECGKGFKKKGHLLQHGVIHSSARPFGCSTCSRAFNRRESLTRHEKIHEEKPFRCPACGRAFRESTSLLNHAASGTCGKPGRGPKQRNGKIESDGEDRGSGVGNGGGGTYQSNRGGIYGKTEEDEGIIIVGEAEPKSGLGCDGLYQSGRGGNSNDRDRTDGKYATDYSRNRYTGYHDDHRSQSNPSPCYSGASPCGGGMAGPALRKAPLAPTLHPHSQTHPHHHPQQQQHLPLSSLLDDTEDDVTSSVNSAISAITAANSGGPRGDERGDIIGGLLGGLGLGPLGSPSSTTMDKTYRAIGEQEAMSSTQDPCAKPKRPRKPRAKKEPTANEDPSKRRQYMQRMSTSGLPRTHLCSVCGKGFARRETLRRHDRIHTGEKPHHCTVCGKYFREAFHLSKHQTVHSGAKNYKCTICGKEFGYSQSLRRHGKLHQKGENEEIPATPATTENLNSFNPNPQCVVQDRNQNQVPSTSSYYSYSQDVKSQDTNPPSQPPRLYTCAICWKSFRHHFHLTAHHQTVHEGGGEKVFSCEVCGKSFAYSNSLTRHKQSQHGITRTETSNTHESSSRPANNQSASEVNQSTSESEAATNTLLQMTPSSEAHVGPVLPVVSHSHTQPPSHPSAGYSPLFYDTVASSSAPTYPQPLPPNSTLMPPQHPHSPAGVKGEHIYPAGSHSHTLHTTAPFQPLTELPSAEHHHLHHHLHQSHLHPHHVSDTPPQQQADCSIDLSQENIVRHKTRKKKSNRQDWRENKWDSRDIVKYGAKKRNKKKCFSVSGRYNKKRTHKRNTVRSVRGHKLINSAEFKTLSSLKVPVKRFGCPICPSSVFSHRAGLLVHRAVKHTQKALSSQERLICRVCGKQSDGPFATFIHRAAHHSRGTFSCTLCRLHFWNATLLHRHKASCRRRAKGLHKAHAKKQKQEERSETEAQLGDVQDKTSFL